MDLHKKIEFFSITGSGVELSLKSTFYIKVQIWVGIKSALNMMKYFCWYCLFIFPFPIIEYSTFFFAGMSDKIRFITDRRIYVVGFGLYGSIHGPCEYQVTIQVKNFCLLWLKCSPKLYIKGIINAQMNPILLLSLGWSGSQGST